MRDKKNKKHTKIFSTVVIKAKYSLNVEKRWNGRRFSFT